MLAYQNIKTILQKLTKKFLKNGWQKWVTKINKIKIKKVTQRKDNKLYVK